MKVRFSSFWPNSDRTISNFFVPLLAEVSNSSIEIVMNKNIFVDLEIISVYPDQHGRIYSMVNRLNQMKNSQKLVNRNSKFQIWFSGENIRAPLHENFDLYLSFDQTSLEDKTHYLPLWVLNLDWFGLNSAHGFISKFNRQEELMQSRRVDISTYQDRDFCCIFANHLNNKRQSAISHLKELGKVDIFGAVTRIPVKDKFEIAKNYKFILCFENNLYPGYVTEKLLEAYQTTAFPLYWGNDSYGFFNDDAFLNYQNFQSQSEVIQQIEILLNDLTSFHRKLEAPLLKKFYDFDTLRAKLKLIIDRL